MVANLLDGKLVSQKIKDDVKTQVQALDFQPGLATVLVGEDPASQVYIRNKIRSTEACGMRSFHETLPASTTESDLLAKIHALNENPDVHGILVQLPVPDGISEKKVIAAIDPAKDVDGFHSLNVGRLTSGLPGLRPCTPWGVMKLLEHYDISVSGKDAVVIGRSNIVGKPQALMLLEQGATVTVAHSRTQDLAAKVKGADIVVAAVGKPGLVQGDWIKEGAVVIDVGINRLPSGKLTGDVEFELAKEKAAYITPVPGGVGPMTIAMLMSNTLDAAKGIL